VLVLVPALVLMPVSVPVLMLVSMPVRWCADGGVVPGVWRGHPFGRVVV
jgi:hypothetical protein